jgi:hypothetical protein
MSDKKSFVVLSYTTSPAEYYYLNAIEMLQKDCKRRTISLVNPPSAFVILELFYLLFAAYNMHLT